MLSIFALLAGGCNNPEPAADASPVVAASPVTDASSSASPAGGTAGKPSGTGKVAGPPMPPPGPKAPGDFDKTPFKGNGKVVKTASSLQYEDMTVGKGATAIAGKQCVMHYTGTLANGTKFDSSRDRGQPFDFTLGTGGVIKGWDEGVAGMKVGGRRKLTIPYQLGYGEEGKPPVIPPKATLIFDVELMDVR